MFQESFRSLATNRTSTKRRRSKSRSRKRLRLECLEARRLLAAQLSIDIADAAISENGGSTTATVSRDGETTGSITVNLSSSDTTAATVPETVTIPNGQTTSEPFTIEAVDDDIDDGTQTAIITARANTPGSVNYVDDFSSDQIDPFWKVEIESPNATLEQADGILTIHSDVGPQGFLDAGLESATIYPASDFVASVDFRIPEGNALPWLSLAQHPEEADESHVYAVYLYQASEYRVWQDDNVTKGNTLVRSGFGDERTQWHRMRLEYDAETMTAISFIDDIELNRFELDLDQAVVRILMKDNVSYAGPSTVEFDNFQFTYAAPFQDGTASIDVEDDDDPLLTLSIDEESISENGGTATATVTRNTDTTDPLTVTLSSNDTSEATVPESITIEAGQYTSEPFTVTAEDDDIVDDTQTATITAKADGHPDAIDTIDVEDDEVRTLTLEIDPDSVSENGGTATATVTRNDGTSGDLTITLVSDDTSEATVPETVTIAGGSDSESFTVTAVDDLILDGTQTATITASAAPMTFTDDFSSNQVDPFWNFDSENPNAIISQVGGRLTIHSPIAPEEFLDAGLESATIYPKSDFVASVDFRVPNGNALPWLSLAQYAEETPDSHVYGLYLYQASEYRVWQDDNVTVGNTLVADGFGDERTTWHRMRLEYDANTMTVTSFIDDTQLDSFVLDLDQAVVRIFMKDNRLYASDGGSTIEFDNFEFSYAKPYLRGSDSIDVTDDETAGLDVTVSDGTLLSVNESGTTSTLSVALTAQPLENVVVAVSVSDETEAGLSTDSLTFTPQDWDVAQDVIVTGLGDLEEDGDVDFSVELEVVADQSDPGFNGLESSVPGVNANVSVTNVSVQIESGQLMVRDQDTGAVIANGDHDGPMVVDLSASDMTLQLGQLADFDGVLEIKYQEEDDVDFGTGWKVQEPHFVDGVFMHLMQRDAATLHLVNDLPHQNPYNRYDVDFSGDVSSLDALLGINFLGQVGSDDSLPDPVAGQTFAYYYDATGDRKASSLDSLQIINDLSQLAEAEAEQIPAPAALVAPRSSGREARDTVFDQRAEFTVKTITRVTKRPSATFAQNLDVPTRTDVTELIDDVAADKSSNEQAIDWVLKGWL